MEIPSRAANGSRRGFGGVTIVYKQFYGLKHDPFTVNPDHRFLCLTPSAREALASISYFLEYRKGFLAITGEVGTGKTTLLNQAMAWFRQQHVRTAYIFNPRLQVNEFLEYMMRDFGISCGFENKARMLMAINQWLLERYRNREHAVLIVDEAQNLSHEVLEEIRLLTNLETSSEKLLQIILCGQPELEHKLNQPELRQLRQRITLRCRTNPLTREETHQYIARRLYVAGANGKPVFSVAAIDEIYHCTGGIQRLVNLLCEHSLISGYVDHLQPIPSETVLAVAQEFELMKGKNVGTEHSNDWIARERSAVRS